VDLDAFRRHGHAAVDWLADYLEHVGERPVLSSVKPGDVRSQLPTTPPERGEPFAALEADFERVIMPGMTHWGHPGFFAYFPANHSPPSILAELLVAGLGAQCMSWQTSPAATELEQVVMSWLRQMAGLPEGFTGVLQDYASTSTLVALITARDQAPDRVGESVVYLSEEAHSSVAKGARLAGFSPELVKTVPTDDRYAMRPDALEAMIAADRAAGLRPAALVATVGTTSSNAIDPLAVLGPIAKREKLWLHVDAAYGGTAAIVPELRWILEGVEHADSLVMNPHKWMLVNHDCSAYFVRDPDLLLRSFSTSPEYLKTRYDDRVVNYRDWGIPLGRRFRALKLWFVIRSYGVEGIRELVRTHVAWGRTLAERVEAHSGLELAAPAPLGLVCFRCRGGSPEEADERSRALLEAINARGEFFLSHTVLGGRYTIRVALAHRATTEELVNRLWTRVTELCPAG